mgnify:CR=1 FL=1
MTSSANNKLRIGTRDSKLAIWQAKKVQALLAAIHIESVLVPVKSDGDLDLITPLYAMGVQGVFTKTLDAFLLSEKIDIAVHSMKDVPTAFPASLGIAAILPREDPSDVLIANAGRGLGDLPPGARVGTSSVRRTAQLLRARPDLKCVLLRGNVDTRLAKLAAGEMDAILLAMAGLKRLGLIGQVGGMTSVMDWLPSLGQGAVGIELRLSDARTLAAVSQLDDEATATALACERAFQAALDGSCKTSIAGLARIEGAKLLFHGEVIAPDGKGVVDS